MRNIPAGSLARIIRRDTPAYPLVGPVYNVRVLYEGEFVIFLDNLPRYRLFRGWVDGPAFKKILATDGSQWAVIGNSIRAVT